LAQLRDEHRDGQQHSRTPANLAHLVVGWRYFLRFAAEAGAIDATERQALEARVAAAVCELGLAQARHHQDAEPAAPVLPPLRSWVVSGRAHVAGPKGEDLGKHSRAWGWRLRTIGTGDHAHDEWQPQGRRVGWLEGEHLYLDPEAAHAEAQKFAAEKGESLAV